MFTFILIKLLIHYSINRLVICEHVLVLSNSPNLKNIQFIMI